MIIAAESLHVSALIIICLLSAFQLRRSENPWQRPNEKEKELCGEEKKTAVCYMWWNIFGFIFNYMHARLTEKYFSYILIGMLGGYIVLFTLCDISVFISEITSRLQKLIFDAFTDINSILSKLLCLNFTATFLLHMWLAVLKTAAHVNKCQHQNPID